MRWMSMLAGCVFIAACSDAPAEQGEDAGAALDAGSSADAAMPVDAGMEVDAATADSGVDAGAGAMDAGADLPFPMDQAGSAGAPDGYKGLPLALVDNGEPTVTAVSGVIGLVCIGPSFINMECGSLINRISMGEFATASDVVVVNCGVPGAGLDAWNNPARDADLWNECINTRLPAAGVGLNQVAVVYSKAVTGNDTNTAVYPDPSADYFEVISALDTFSARVASFFPSVTAVYMTSRSYGGFSTPGAEPRSYESGHALNTWLASHSMVGNVWWGWGAYIWAPECTTGVTNGSGVCYDRDDYAADGVHPSIPGRRKISQMMHDRLSEHAWYQP